MKRIAYTKLLVFVALVASRAAYAIPIGLVQWNVTNPGTAGEFDILNETGPNSSVFPDTTFPVTASVSLSGLSLTVHFTDGSTTIFGSSYFTLLLVDGLSFDGTSIPIAGGNPLPTDATLTGTFSPTLIALNDGSPPFAISPGFSATIPFRAGGLNDADFAVIDAAPAPVPEPETLMLLGTGIVGLLRLRRR